MDRETLNELIQLSGIVPVLWPLLALIIGLLWIFVLTLGGDKVPKEFQIP